MHFIQVFFLMVLLIIFSLLVFPSMPLATVLWPKLRFCADFFVKFLLNSLLPVTGMLHTLKKCGYIAFEYLLAIYTSLYNSESPILIFYASLSYIVLCCLHVEVEPILILPVVKRSLTLIIVLVYMFSKSHVYL